jgi:hypothetical protein
MTCSMIVSRSSLLETTGECCVETTTAEARMGRFPSYSIVTCDLPSGRRKSTSPSFRICERRIDDLVREHDRQRHQLLGLAAGEAEHQALVSRAAGVDALRDVGRLRIDRGDDRAGLAVETVLRARVADVADRRADDRREVDVGAVVVISPEIIASPVVTSVSQATRPVGSSARTASRIASEIWSAILSG